MKSLEKTFIISYDLHLFLKKNLNNFSFTENEKIFSLATFDNLPTKIIWKNFSLLCKNQKFVKKGNKLNNDNCTVNLSSRSLIYQETRLLELSLNFPQSSKSLISKLIAPIESSFKFSTFSPYQKESLQHIHANTFASNNLNYKFNLTY